MQTTRARAGKIMATRSAWARRANISGVATLPPARPARRVRARLRDSQLRIRSMTNRGTRQPRIFLATELNRNRSTNW